MSDTPGDKLRKLRQRHGFSSAAAAARAHGWIESTYASHENGTRPISIKAAHRYAKAYKVDVAELHPLASAAPTSTVLVEVMGGSAVGVWRDGALADQSDGEDELTIPVLRDGDQMRAAVRVNDESMNRVFRLGEYAIVDLECRQPPEAGMIVYVERRRGPLAETSLRLVETTREGGLRLACHSTHKRFVESIPYPSQRSDETVTIVGLVVGKYADIPPRLLS